MFVDQDGTTMQQHPPGAGGCFMGMLSPGHGARKLEGKSFYLDAVKSRPAAFLAEAISHLGGVGKLGGIGAN